MNAVGSGRLGICWPVEGLRRPRGADATAGWHGLAQPGRGRAGARSCPA